MSRPQASPRKQRVAIIGEAGNLRRMKPHAREEILHHDEMDSPVGKLRLIASDTALVGIWFEHGRDAARGRIAPVRTASPLLARVRVQLEEYFAGSRREFDLPLDARGTEFQRRVWTRLRRIAYGETTTYGALACELGDPGASRAVGLANGSNPIPIVIPCHRVIGADGSLTGFGGGLPVKRMLLDLEHAAVQPRLL
jgi:methylated-DNA-[protein]-cysteine S-methyltransferase